MPLNTLAVLETIEPFDAETSVERLVDAAREDDREAFGLLVLRYQDAVRRTVLKRVHNEAVADELCQEVFLHAMMRLGQLRDSRCFGGWIRTMAANMAINHVTRRGIDASAGPALLDSTGDGRPTPLAAILRTEEAAEVRRGLAALGATDRATLEAFYIDNSSLVEMSRQFAAPVGTIKRRLHVARKRLAARLEPACA